jgi:hypothetical protein
MVGLGGLLAGGGLAAAAVGAVDWFCRARRAGWWVEQSAPLYSSTVLWGSIVTTPSTRVRLKRKAGSLMLQGVKYMVT